LIIRDHSGQKLAYVYFEDEPGRHSAAKLLTKDEARRIAPNIAKLPGVASEDLVGVYQLTRQVNRVFEPISAGVARPRMPNAIIGQMLRPFRGNDIRLALRTLVH